ncbi:MAG TPA: C13 family peptidase, partial [Xanthobacteraceae bacterium]|nr:C13 family peptidase [Xanthobacteraceae bacterium]
MASIDNDALRTSIQQQAFLLVPATRREHVNLYLDSTILAAGQTVGPDFQNIKAPASCVVVFADKEPAANFGHPCSYHFFDATNGNHLTTVPARFPPYATKPPETLVGFHLPVRTGPTTIIANLPPIARCPILLPDGTRYAILYAGMSNMRHLNDLEFCYRMLIDRYGFAPANITALSYDGTLNTQDGLATKWPGDGNAYRIKINGQGNKAAFEAAFASLKTKLGSNDLLFIHTNNHGDNNGQQSFLCEYPNWGQYMATDFCTDLATLPKYRALMVMMEQCNSGGFNQPVLKASTAASTSIASAAIATQSSYASPDGNWDSFARDWIAAEFGHEPNGAGLAHNPDTNGDGVVSAKEAFNYALSVQNPSDSPNYASTSSPS